MNYTVAEAAEKTGLSKTSIYKRLQTDELKQHTAKKQGITYITENGLKLIQESMNHFTNNCNNLENEKSKIFFFSSIHDNYINYLKSENERLWGQIEKLSQLVENGQVLLKEKQIQDVQLLQEHCIEVDEKIINVKEKMSERSEKKSQKKKNFFERLFSI